MTTALDIQTDIKTRIAEAAPELASRGVEILCEDALDISATANAALQKVGIVGIVATPTFSPAGQGYPVGHCAIDAEVRIEFYETAANRLSNAEAVTALSAALYVATVLPAGFTLVNIAQDSPGDGILRATATIAETIAFTTETTTQTTEN